MYSIVLLTAMMSGGQGADFFGYGWHGYAGYYGCYGCYGCGGCYGWYGGWGSCCGCCGTVTPGLMPGPMVTEMEQRAWDAYVDRLDSDDDKRDVCELWARADFHARRKLVAKIPPPEKEDKEDKKSLEKEDKKPLEKEDKKSLEKEKPISAAEQKKWDDYVKTLEGDKKTKAENDWKKADLTGKRKLIDDIPEE
jgi:hypothetical protein